MSFSPVIGHVSALEFVHALLPEQSDLATNTVGLGVLGSAFTPGAAIMSSGSKEKDWSEKGAASHCDWPAAIRASVSFGHYLLEP